MKLVIKILLGILLLTSCSSAPEPKTPMETLKLYVAARKKKDAVTMKSLLSKGSIKMSEDEAKASNKPLDEVILGETIFPENVTQVNFRNEKTEGENASIEVNNQFGSFDTISFVKEDDKWKIAKDKFKDNIMQSVDEEMKKLDEQINQGRQP